MDYNDEQRAIITRIGEASAQIRATVAAHRQAQAAAGRGMIDAVTALTQAIERSNELGPLLERHNDLWLEFLDTLT